MRKVAKRALHEVWSAVVAKQNKNEGVVVTSLESGWVLLISVVSFPGRHASKAGTVRTEWK